MHDWSMCVVACKLHVCCMHGWSMCVACKLHVCLLVVHIVAFPVRECVGRCCMRGVARVLLVLVLLAHCLLVCFVAFVRSWVLVGVEVVTGEKN